MRKKKIKILHVAQAAGGVDRYIRMLLKYLDRRQLETFILVSLSAKFFLLGKTIIRGRYGI